MVDPFEGMISDYSPEVQAVCQALRKIIREAAPEAGETIHSEQRHAAYAPASALDKEVILLAPKKNFTFLVFKGGKQIRDIDGLLGGDGKSVRFMTVKTLEEANNPALVKLISASWANALASTAG